ncbi:MAG: GNAT family N-acetyltransferase [Pseudomonadota bacterium]
MSLRPLDHLPTPSWPVALQQHPVFAAALAHLGVEHRCLGWSDRVNEGAVLVMQRRFGPIRLGVASRAHLTPQVASDLAHRFTGAFGALAITPETHTHLAGALPVATPAHVAEWDLTQSQAARRAAVSGAFRTALRKAESGRLKTRTFAPSRDTLLTTLARDAAQQRRKGFRALPAHLVLAIHAARPEALLVFQAHQKGEVLAEVLTILHAPAATYHLGWTSPRGRDAQATNLLLWTAANMLADRGVERFDLGLVATDRSPGLARFKIATGARVRPLGPTLFFGPLTGLLSRFAPRDAYAAA